MVAKKSGSVLGKRKTRSKGPSKEEEEEEVLEMFDHLTVAELKAKLKDFGLSTVGKKAILVERLTEAMAEPVKEEEDEPEDEVMAEEDYSSLTVAKLKNILKERGLSTAGKKSSLIARLEESDAEANGESAPAEEEEEELPEPPKKKKATAKKSAANKKAGAKADRVRSREAAHAIVGCFDDVAGAPPKVTSLKVGRDTAPPFPTPVSIVRHVVLQVTDLKNNHNKYYSLELQQSGNGASAKYRLYTHYGRTDDLSSNPNAGVRELRVADNLPDAKRLYNKLYKDKTSARKGYQPVNLSSSAIGSEYVKGKSSGYVDDDTKEAMAKPASEKESAAAKKKAKIAKTKKASDLHSKVQQLVRKVYDAATNSLTSQANVSITANGIETPLGILTLAQIEDGQFILDEILAEIKKNGGKNRDKLMELSGEFYTTIPHRIGRSAAAVRMSTLSTEEQYKAKSDLMQLMKDMLEVCESESGSGNVFYEDDVDAKYHGLSCDLTYLSPGSDEHKQLMDFLSITQNKGIGDYGDNRPKATGKVSYRVLDVYKVHKEGQEKVYSEDMENQHLLYHGSRISNWMGLLSRGILMPQAVTKLGVQRTDFGWLGAGIYFGDCYKTSQQYCTPGNDGGSLAMICEVALGKVHEQALIDGSIVKPPKGFDSIHGNPTLPGAGFADHEYCVYTQQQQTPRYLVHFKR